MHVSIFIEKPFGLGLYKQQDHVTFSLFEFYND